MITKCLSCGKIFDVELSWKGQTATCDSCGKDFTVKKYIECPKCDCLVPDDSPTCYKCNAKLAVPIEYEISTKTEEKVAEKTTVMVSIINWIKTTAKLEIIPEEINTESEEKAMKCSKCEGCDSSIFKEAQHKLNIPMATNTMPEKKSEEQFNWGCISLVVILLLGLFLITDGYFRLGIIKGLELRYCKEDIAVFVKKYDNLNYSQNSDTDKAIKKQAIDFADKYRAIRKLQGMKQDESELRDLMGKFYPGTDEEQELERQKERQEKEKIDEVEKLVNYVNQHYKPKGQK